jgi:hypothetical protein
MRNPSESTHGIDCRSSYAGGVVRNNIFDRAQGLGVQPIAKRDIVADPSGRARARRDER